MASKRKEDDEPSAKGAAKKAKATGPTTGADGWTTHPPSLIYKINEEVQAFDKVAAFDLDGTVVNTKSGRDFPIGADDWQFLNPSVVSVIQGIHKEGYRIVIFTNQGAIKSALEGKGATNVKGRLDTVIKQLGVPVAAFISTQKDKFRKPDTGMWDFMCEQLPADAQPDKKSSYFVGDAAGRPGDIAPSDKEFAANVGIGFKTPEECFGDKSSGGVNAELCNRFNELAELLKLKSENMKSNAFRKVALALMEHPSKITTGKQAGELKGVGKSSVKLIDEFLATGKMQALLDMKAEQEAPASKQDDPTKPKSGGLAFL